MHPSEMRWEGFPVLAGCIIAVVLLPTAFSVIGHRRFLISYGGLPDGWGEHPGASKAFGLGQVPRWRQSCTLCLGEKRL